MSCIPIWPVIARGHRVQDVTCHVRVLHDYSSRIQSPLHEEQNAIPQEAEQQHLSVIWTGAVSLSAHRGDSRGAAIIPRRN